MPEYLAPGVYVEEIEIGAKPIEGVSTSTAGFLGETERGPTTSRLVTSWLEYQRIYGSYFGEDKYIPYAVKGFFDNGGKRCYIGRIVKQNAQPSSLKLKKGNNNAITIEALGEGNWGNKLVVKVTKATVDGFKLSVFYWKNLPATLSNWDADINLNSSPDVVEIFDNVSTDQNSMDFYEKRVNGNSNLIKLSKKPGDTGVKPEVGVDGIAQGGGAASSTTSAHIMLDTSASSDSGAYNNMQIEIIDGKGKGQIRNITNYTVSTNGKKVEVNQDWDDVPDTTSKYHIIPKFFSKDYIRDDTVKPDRKGLIGFEEIDDVSIIYSPNPKDVNGLTSALITHCETLKDRFAIIDAKQGSNNVSEINPRDTNDANNHVADTKYAAFYYPWIKIVDPNAGFLKLIPPGGHIAGIYARSDSERGVHKAPANETVREASDLEFQITNGEQDILNPRGVNVIRAFPARGIRVWGARTLSSDSLWKYINVRRLFIFLEESIDEGTQWVVFEPNDEKLWARVRQTITQFLTQVWKDGALMGNTPEEAFFVKCDRATMTQNDIDTGKLIVQIGVAPVKPAEFVIFRIAQVTAGAKG